MNGIDIIISFSNLLINRVNQVKTEDLFLLHTCRQLVSNQRLSGKSELNILSRLRTLNKPQTSLNKIYKNLTFQNQQTILSTWLDQIPQSSTNPSSLVICLPGLGEIIGLESRKRRKNNGCLEQSSPDCDAKSKP